MLSKRARMDVPVVVNRQAKRPVEKSLVVINATVGTAVAANTVSLTTSGSVGAVGNAMTYSGGHIQISYFPTTAATVIVGFALIVLRQGTTVNSPTLTSAQTFYAPEQDVLWSHYAVLPSNTASAATTVVVPTAKIKTMRKLKLGDAVVFVAISSWLLVSGCFPPTAFSIDLYGSMFVVPNIVYALGFLTSAKMSIFISFISLKLY